jgi:hypothetical protein
VVLALLGVGGLATAAVGESLLAPAATPVEAPIEARRAPRRVHPRPAPPAPEPPAEAPPPAAVPPPEQPTPPVAEDAAAFRSIQDDRGGDPAALVTEIDAFLHVFPRSRFAADAGALRLGARARIGDPAHVVDEAEAWLAAYPADARRAEIHALAGRLARDGLHDCARALPHDRAAADGLSGRARAIAATWSGLCAVATGDRARGLRELQRVDAAALPPELARARADALARPDPSVGRPPRPAPPDSNAPREGD